MGVWFTQMSDHVKHPSRPVTGKQPVNEKLLIEGGDEEKSNEEKRPRNISEMTCYWCGKPGHIAKKCWQKLGACLICGSLDHLRRDCPKHKNEWSEKNANQTTKCPNCGGAHFEVHCPLN